MTRRYKYASVFKRLYVFKGYKFNGFDLKKDAIFAFLKRIRKTSTCPSCGKRCKRIEESIKRTIRDIDIGNLESYITFFENKIQCRCGYRGIEKLEFTRPYSRTTMRFEEFVALLCEKMSLKDVSGIVKLNWKTVKAIDKLHIKSRLTPLEDIYPTRIGIDEIAYKKRYNYLTIVRDLDLGKVIWIGINRKEETLDRFFQALGIIKTRNIKLTVLDMWDPYIASLRKNCPSAEIIFDKFHVVKKVNEALDSVRKAEFARADPIERKLMKKKRFLILARNKHLEEKNKESLNQLLDQNKTLYASYLLKEQLSDIMDEDNPGLAIKRLKRWIKNASKSGIAQFDGCVKTISNYMYGIHNFFRNKVTNAASEGFNNKIGVIKRRAYGFRDFEYFMLKIFQSCGWRSS